MSSLNKVQIIGNLGADPEVRDANGTKVVNLSVATSERWNDKTTGEKKERTEWHRVTIFGGAEHDGIAGVAEKYLKKGGKVYLEGKLQTRKWQDQQGVDRYSTEIVLTPFNGQMVLLDAPTGAGRAPGANSPDDYGQTRTRDDAPVRSRPQSNAPAFEPGGMDDDIPF